MIRDAVATRLPKDFIALSRYGEEKFSDERFSAGSRGGAVRDSATLPKTSENFLTTMRGEC